MFNVYVVFQLRRASDCVEGVSFRASRFGVPRCFEGFGVGWWVFEYTLFFSCVVLLPASKESRVGRRASECLVAFRV